ncbi:MAG TPA: methyltransferase domain-containing protein [Nitrosomonas sp.]|nr:methyltransferase domain-containing protein [Nitrosomonas sp.]
MKALPKKVSFISNLSLSHQWDNIAQERNNQLRLGKDLSFQFVLMPTILKLVDASNKDCVLDAGCGSGVLTELIAKYSKQVVGIDMSRINIRIADSSINKLDNIKYTCGTIEAYAKKITQPTFSLLVANMLLQDAKNLKQCINAFSKIILPGGHLVFSITHPWFWPTYWGYDKYDWFKYDEEIAIEAPFRVSSDKDVIGITTHFHRPISHYLSELHNFGFEIDRLIEPMPRKEIELKYPNLWEFPRFIVIKCIRK